MSSSIHPVVAPAEPNVLDKIRLATRSLHEKAEKFVGLPGSIAEHVSVLKRFYSIQLPWEKLVAPTLAPLESELGDRRKTPWIEADLLSLGLSKQQIDSIPRAPRLPTIDSVCGALGSMYVFEGATLGGQIIARHLESKLHLADGRGYSYYRSYGEQVGEKWKSFKSTLINHCPPNRHDQAVAAACETFECVCEALAKNG